MTAAWDRLADLSARRIARVFGQPVRYAGRARDPNAPWVDIQGIFDPEHSDLTLGGAQGTNTVPITDVTPILDIRIADLAAAPARGDQVEIAGQVYTVVDIEGAAGGPVFRLRLHRGGHQGV